MRGEDIHAATAALITGVPLAEVTKTQRGFAKRVNFGLLYGMGAFRLARESELTEPEARKFIQTYFEKLPNIQRYHADSKRLAREQGYLTTLFGRRRRFPGLSGSHNEIQAAEREAINMPIQGTAADLIKLAMIALHAELNRHDLGARLLLQVHDELVLEAPDNTAEEVAALTQRVMEAAHPLDARLVANAALGPNWYEAK
jgi:DNA polymerase-1